MTLVSQNLIYEHIKGRRKLYKMFRLLEEDVEVQSYLKMANVMAVSRLKYNDHGVVHSRITAGGALEILSILVENGIMPSIVDSGMGSMEDSMLVAMCGAYLHDIGNAVHRVNHHFHGCTIASPILDRLMPKIYRDKEHMLCLKQEIIHCIFSHDENVNCLSIEAGVVKVADGTDMAGGRARIPYKIGKVDIHSLSALAIESVEIVRGETRPVKIVVNMNNPAGVFQIEEVLMKKIATSGLGEKVEVIALKNGKELKTIKG